MWAVKDTLAIVGRNLITIRRLPQLLVFSTIQPIIFVLMFRYVFGGAINIPGLTVPYVDYLMPGIFVQTVAFGAVNTAIGLAEDLQKGLIERFRSLPMARSAVMAGRTIADLVRDVFVVLLMSVVGFIVGFRIHTNVFIFVGGLLVLLLFAFSLAWVFGFIGLATGQAETAQAASFPILAILTFASSAFVSPETMPPLAPVVRRAPAAVDHRRRRAGAAASAARRRRMCSSRSCGAWASSPSSRRSPCASTAAWPELVGRRRFASATSHSLSSNNRCSLGTAQTRHSALPPWPPPAPPAPPSCAPGGCAPCGW